MKNSLSSRERVKSLLARKEIDRIPVDFGGTVVTCLDYNEHKKLKRYFGICDDSDSIIDYSMGTVSPSEALMRLFGSDFRRVSLNTGIPNIIDNMYEDGFGIRLRKAVPHEYSDVIGHPLENAGINDLDGMKMPDPDEPGLYYGLKDRARDLFENSPYAIVADFGVPGFYETSQKLRGYENLACDMLIGKEFITALYEKLFELQKKFFKNYLDSIGKYAMIIGYADDLGMQDRLQISPDTYREMIKPWHKRIFSFIHEHTDAKILLHSCGAIEPIIDDLIEIGTDILNPVQVRAKDMEPEKLKKKYGDRIIFWGGIDEQYILPKAPPDEVRRYVFHMMRILGNDGGYVLAPGHNIQDDTPPGNVKAMFDSAGEFNDNYK